jgi:hypothetical protein
MTNNSGKFISTVSNKETETTAADITTAIPPAPKLGLIHYIEEYFGKYWWAWLILLIIIKNK